MKETANMWKLFRYSLCTNRRDSRASALRGQVEHESVMMLNCKPHMHSGHVLAENTLNWRILGSWALTVGLLGTDDPAGQGAVLRRRLVGGAPVYRQCLTRPGHTQHRLHSLAVAQPGHSGGGRRHCPEGPQRLCCPGPEGPDSQPPAHAGHLRVPFLSGGPV